MRKGKVILSRDVPGSPGKVPGPDRTGPRDLEGPVVLWSRDLTSQKVPGLENWKSPMTMETLLCTQSFLLNCKSKHIIVDFNE